MDQEIGADLVGAVCPVPVRDQQQIVLGHGSGGKLSAELLQKIFCRRSRMSFSPASTIRPSCRSKERGWRLPRTRVRRHADFFPGGNIGDLAINGTINDLAMSGAKPLYIAAAFILEEGLAMADLERVVGSMSAAARCCGVQLVTGDTKVVNRGKGDKIFITTTGIGLVDSKLRISADRARPGDKILLSGTVGDHGIAIMSRRENLEFESAIESDTAPLHTLVAEMIEASERIHCLRDPTRGGVATTLNELAASSRVGMVIDERQIPVRSQCKALAKFSASIRSMSPTKASFWRSSVRKTQRQCCKNARASAWERSPGDRRSGRRPSGNGADENRYRRHASGRRVVW